MRNPYKLLNIAKNNSNAYNNLLDIFYPTAGDSNVKLKKTIRIGKIILINGFT